MGRIVWRAAAALPPERFAWSHHPAAEARLAAEAGMALEKTVSGEFAIRDTSPEAYVAAGQDHPMALAMRSTVLRAGAEAEAREAMITVLREANEDHSSFLVHSPYVLHELRPL